MSNSSIGKSLRLSVIKVQPSSKAMAATIMSARVKVPLFSTIAVSGFPRRTEIADGLKTLSCWRYGYQFLYFRTQQVEVTYIPGIKVVCASLEGTRRNQPVIDRSTYNPHPGDAANGGTILIAVEPYQSEPVLNFLYK
jgi:hypothetical protein